MAAGISSAAVSVPEWFAEDFGTGWSGSAALPEGWTGLGNGAVPAESMTEWFGDTSDGPAYVLRDYSGLVMAMSCTNFAGGEAADQWLLTPEIEIPVDAAELSFTVGVDCNRGNWGQGKNPYRVLVSESGSSDREAFSEEPLVESTVNGSRTQDLSTKDIVCPLNGYAGKKIRLAFVSSGTDMGMTGFGNISLGDYAISLDNRTAKVAEIDQDVTVTVNVAMKTPVACPGFTATLNIGGETYEQYYKKPFGNVGNTVVYQLVKFDPFTITEAHTYDYEITVQPDYEGAPASAVTGTVGVPVMKYPANVVVEELTASGCQACPAGTAAMQYYGEVYPGDEEGMNRVIGIAVHGLVNYHDPMSVGVEMYLNSLMTLNGTTAYPQAMFNRASRGMMPYRRSEVERLMPAGSYHRISITGVTTDADNESPWGKEVTVTCDARSAYDADNLNLRIAALMIENDVRGNNSGYSQTNGFYNRPQSYVEANYGDFLVPYMLEYLQGGELAQAIVPYSKMVYNHVARGIWPSFEGEQIEGEWVVDSAHEASVTFTIPETVMRLENTEVVVLLIDGETSEIVGSDILPASRYNESDAVAAVGRDSVGVVRYGDLLTVTAADGCVAEVYDLAGIRVMTLDVDGSATAVLPAGRYIVRAVAADGVHTFKI